MICCAFFPGTNRAGGAPQATAAPAANTTDAFSWHPQEIVSTSCSHPLGSTSWNCFLEPLHGIFFVWAFHYHIPLAQVMSGTCGPVCCGKNWAPIDGSQLFCEHFIPSHCKPVSCNFMMPCEILGRQLWRNLSETSPVQIHGTQVMEEHLSLPPPSPKTHPNLFPVPLAGPKYGAKPKGQAMPPSGRKLQGPSCGSSRHSCQGGGI